MSDSAGFDKLAKPVQKWIWQQKWSGLRSVQEDAIGHILTQQTDLVISAPTAGGKTEAVFLPIFSELLNHPSVHAGFRVLAISPLKALINDQAFRLTSLSEATSIAFHKWHGDVAASKKKSALKSPEGVLMITPESLEAMFVLRGNELQGMFAGLEFIVVDELHAFIGSERGVHLQSLMHRVEQTINRSIIRIGLSATIGDMELAKAALRPNAEELVTAIKSESREAELLLQIRGYANALVAMQVDGDQTEEDEETNAVTAAISEHLFKTLRGTTNLVFAGSRQKVEIYSDRLQRFSDRLRVPNEFVPHHGNLSKEIREDTEERLKSADRPATAICTTTLELGIDIGDVESVAQIGPPTNISGLKQRLGRSGRRPGKPAILRIYAEEIALSEKTQMLDQLRPNTVLAVAAIDLLLLDWCEPPEPRALHLSTFIHQILSCIVSHGGIKPENLFDLLCGTGPFINIDRDLFVSILKQISKPEVGLIEQSPDRTLMLGKNGEIYTEHYSFYAVFQTSEEYRVEAGGKTLGTLPIDNPLVVGNTIIFAGRRWTLKEIWETEKLLIVVPSSSGTPVKFGGDPGPIHDRVIKSAFEVYNGEDIPGFLNQQAAKHLKEARAAFQRNQLNNSGIISSGRDTLIFPWVGTKKLLTLQLALVSQGLEVEEEGRICLLVKNNREAIVAALKNISVSGNVEALHLAKFASGKLRNKFDHCLSDEQVDLDFCSSQLDVDGIASLAEEILR